MLNRSIVKSGASVSKMTDALPLERNIPAKSRSYMYVMECHLGVSTKRRGENGGQGAYSDPWNGAQ